MAIHPATEAASSGSRRMTSASSRAVTASSFLRIRDSASTELRDKLEDNTKFFRAALTERGLTIKPGVHPIVPIMLYDERLAHDHAPGFAREKHVDRLVVDDDVALLKPPRILS